MADLLDSQISKDLSVYPNPDIENDTSCMGILQKELEKRQPLTLNRLGLFSSKQGVNQSFTDYVAMIKKKSETADISNFTADNILSYILLSGCNDQGILEEVLKISRNPDFEQICKIGTNLEISRTVLEALPGAQGQFQKRNQSLKISNRKDKAEKESKRHPANDKLEALQFFKREGICHRCGTEGEHKCKVRSDTKCFKCSHSGHYGRMCLNYNSSSSSDNDSDLSETDQAEERERADRESSNSEQNQSDESDNE